MEEKEETAKHYLLEKCGESNSKERSQRPQELVAHKIFPLVMWHSHSPASLNTPTLSNSPTFSPSPFNSLSALFTNTTETTTPPPRRDSTASDVHGDRETRERLGVGTDRVIAGAGETQRVSQFKDPTMKLFGMTISLPPSLETCVHEIREGGDRSDQNLGSSNASSQEENFAGEGARREGDQVTLGGGEPIEDIQEDSSSHQTVENPNDQTTSSGISENPKTPMVDRETSSLKPSSKGEDGETVSQDKTLKKPDKILPCPRCNSMDTKFCYYNNYNVNQPRHFCKNCQRYWTAGGTMRNVPVGAGRRKNKNSSGSHFSHIIVPEALQTARANGVPNSALGKNGTVLNFATDSPLCESMASVLKLAEKTQNHVRNGLHRPEQRDTGDDRSSGSSITASNSIEKEGLQDSAVKNYPGFPPQVQCFQGNWPVEWNSAQWSSVMPPQVLCASGFPLSFYPPPAYWGCAVPGSWNIQSPPPPSSVPRHGQSSAPNSATLGKHSRDGSILNPANPQKEDAVREQSSERCLWIPKTLRIDDSSDAERNSIWATLGLKNEKTNPANGGRLFKAFQSRNDNKSYGVETCPVLQANPAALSRSLNFHESS